MYIHNLRTIIDDSRASRLAWQHALKHNLPVKYGVLVGETRANYWFKIKGQSGPNAYIKVRKGAKT